MSITVYPADANVSEFGNPKRAITQPVDSYGRLRVSDKLILFDSKQIFDAKPLFWDDVQETGSGTSSTHSVNAARSRLAVSNLTAGKRTRQTFMRFNYQTGRAQQVIINGVLNQSGGGTGIKQKMGIFDDNDGLFLQNNAGTIQIVRRSNVTGTPVDLEIPRSSWDDPMDGTGRSGVSLDFTKIQSLHIGYKWPVGSVRWSFFVDDELITFHQEPANSSLSVVYMSKPNLPVRFQIENDGTGGAAALDAVSASVASEGGIQRRGTLRSISTDGVHVDANTADTIYAVVGFRLKSTQLANAIVVESIAMLSETNDDFQWLLIMNPTVAGTFTYNDLANSSIQFARGATANTVTGGRVIQGGWIRAQDHFQFEIDLGIRPGVSIAGVRDTVILCARPLSSNSDVQGTINFREGT